MKPLVVCICGSMRYQAQMEQAALELSLAGFIVVMPHCNLKEASPWWPADQQEHIKQDLDLLHRAKIDLADEVLVVAPRTEFGDWTHNGHIGDSTKAEIAYAKQTHKPVSYWREPGYWEGHLVVAKAEAES